MKALTVYQTEDGQYFANEELAKTHETNIKRLAEHNLILQQIEEDKKKAEAVRLAQEAIDKETSHLEAGLKDELNAALITAKCEPQSQFMIDAVGVLQTLLGEDDTSEDSDDYSSSEEYYNSNCY